ncbi:THAP domain-containing protein 2-like [Schistocerca piceifrons]|uniref:THAP domain-containing protein 2-like n=1 Tax=Schistocerca piceifrons TaxID=274613 RepID=UPI001F5FDB29|nr:THAP domain-containing protein 2-like [Schistocerca piceifrons]
MKRENWFSTTASYLCSAHFEEKYMYHTNVQRRLLSKPVPTIFNFPSHLQKQDKVLRPQHRKRSFDNLQDSAITVTSLAQMPVGPTSVSADHNYCLPSPKKLKTQYNRVQTENVRLKKRIKQMKQISVRHKRRIVQLQTVAGLRRRLCSSVSDMLNSEHVVGLLKELLELQCSAKAAKVGLQLSLEKTKFLTNINDTPSVLQLEQGQIEKVDRFKHLGEWLEHELSEGTALTTLINKLQLAYRSTNIIRNAHLTITQT